MKAPNFELINNLGEKVSLETFKGKNIVLYFYPMDNTPGCTKEACEFRNNIQSFNDKNVVVLGVSRDGIDMHNEFINKFKLPFQLLVDKKGRVAKKYDSTFKPKSSFTKRWVGRFRHTYLINKNGEVVHYWKKVNVNDHIQEIQSKINELNW